MSAPRTHIALSAHALRHLLALYGDEFTLGELVALSLSPAWPLASLCTVRGRA